MSSARYVVITLVTKKEQNKRQLGAYILCRCVHPALNATPCLSDVSSQLSATHTDDWGRFARTLMEIRANRADGEEEGPMELAS